MTNPVRDSLLRARRRGSGRNRSSPALSAELGQLLLCMLFLALGCNDGGHRPQDSSAPPQTLSGLAAPADSLWARNFNLPDYERMTGLSVPSLSQAPFFDSLVSVGALPPVEDRLPANPLVVVPWEALGSYGGGDCEFAKIGGNPFGDLVLFLEHRLALRNQSLKPANLLCHLRPLVGRRASQARSNLTTAMSQALTSLVTFSRRASSPGDPRRPTSVRSLDSEPNRPVSIPLAEITWPPRMRDSAEPAGGQICAGCSSRSRR